MKNDPKALHEILQGKLVIPIKWDYIYITADVDDLAEYILIPQKIEPTSDAIRRMLVQERGIYLTIPGENDEPISELCVVMENNSYGVQEFTWIKEAGCWAYYPKI